MGINDVSLTSGMRSNLLSLQGTVNLLDRTQNRLSSGKKVNTAIDNPVSFFASQALTSRASIIDSLKDAMGQAVQTITAADKGITAISSLIEQAKGIAQSALSAQPGTPVGEITLSGVRAGFDTATATLTNVADGDSFALKDRPTQGLLFTAMLTPVNPSVHFQLVAGDMNASADNLATFLTNRNWAGPGQEWSYTAQYIAGTNTVEISKYQLSDGKQLDFALSDFMINSPSFSRVVNPSATPADEIVIGGVTFTATTGATSGQNFNASGDNTADMNELATAINNYGWASSADYSATVTNGALILSKTVNGAATAVEAGDYNASGIINGGSGAMTLIEPSPELEDLQAQYNTLRTQLSELAEDSGYKGKNLLSEDDLTVKFEGATLRVEGFDASTSGLGITAATWATGSDIDADIDLLDASLVTLRRQSSRMSGNLSIISVRQGFSTDIMNTLTEGADKLTLADANEEGGNMLMLQTRQSLSTSALSMSAQAAQSVLRLFQ